MTNTYKIIGSEMSPYSVKVRSYFRYKNIPHVWQQRTLANQDEFQKYAKLPLVPLVVLPDDTAMQDSTPIIEKLEVEHPAPSIYPEDPALKFLCQLIEEYGDEWGNKLMFHHRWGYAADQAAVPVVLARTMNPDAPYQAVEEMANMIRERMVGRRYFVGSSDETAPLIEKYFARVLDILEPHLATRKYLFGNRPSFADFGLAMEIYEASIDPTAGGIIRARATNVLDWCFRMIDPKDEGPFEGWETLKEGLEPLLYDVGHFFLPWSVANAKALMDGQESFTVDLDGDSYAQQPQKYHAKSLSVIREKYAALADKSALDPILEKAGCLEWLTDR